MPINIRLGKIICTLPWEFFKRIKKLITSLCWNAPSLLPPKFYCYFVFCVIITYVSNFTFLALLVSALLWCHSVSFSLYIYIYIYRYERNRRLTYVLNKNCIVLCMMRVSDFPSVETEIQQVCKCVSVLVCVFDFHFSSLHFLSEEHSY